MLRTVVRSDDVAFPWLAPAGTRRGTVDNASQLGYVDATTGEFTQTAVRQGLRDTLYENQLIQLRLFLDQVYLTMVTKLHLLVVHLTE